MRPVPLACLLAVCSLVLLVEPGEAAAQEPRSQDKPYFAPEFILGVAGSADVKGANVAEDL